MFSLVLAALSLAFVAARPSATGGTPDASPVLVRGGASYGSGVVWSGSDGLVLTALHVVERMPEIRVSLPGRPEQEAWIVDVDPALDLVLLRTAVPLGRAMVACASALPMHGEAVRLLGWPGLRRAAAPGTVAEPSRRFAGARYLEIAGRAEPGASGGPVVDARGAVVGIVDLVLHGDRDTTLAVPIDLALARFPLPGRELLAGGASRPGAPAEQDSELARRRAAASSRAARGIILAASRDPAPELAPPAQAPGRQSIVVLTSQLTAGSTFTCSLDAVPPTGVTSDGSTPSACVVAGSRSPVVGRSRDR